MTIMLSCSEQSQVDNLLATWDNAPTFPPEMLAADDFLASALEQAAAYDRTAADRDFWNWYESDAKMRNLCDSPRELME